MLNLLNTLEQVVLEEPPLSEQDKAHIPKCAVLLLPVRVPGQGHTAFPSSRLAQGCLQDTSRSDSLAHSLGGPPVGVLGVEASRSWTRERYT